MKSEYRYYKSIRMYKGYPAFNAIPCWIGEVYKNGKYTNLYARTMKELKAKIDEYLTNGKTT